MTPTVLRGFGEALDDAGKSLRDPPPKATGTTRLLKMLPAFASMRAEVSSRLPGNRHIAEIADPRDVSKMSMFSSGRNSTIADGGPAGGFRASARVGTWWH